MTAPAPPRRRCSIRDSDAVRPAAYLPDRATDLHARVLIVVGPLRDRHSLEDGGAELRAHAAKKGHKLELVESTPTSCTVRAARHTSDYDPHEATITVVDVKRAGHDEHPLYLADRQKFLAGWATREAASDVIPDVVLELEHGRQLEPLGIKPPPINATADESRAHFRELMTALEAYQRREAFQRALRVPRRVVAIFARPLTRARGPRARTANARRPSARSPGRQDRTDDPDPDPLAALEAAA